MDIEKKLTSSQKLKIKELEEAALSGKKVKGKDVVRIIEDIFNPLKVYDEAYIPTSFLTTETGNILLRALYISDYNEELTVALMSEELGVTKQYINKCIHNGKIKAKLKAKSYFIRRSEVEIFKLTMSGRKK